ncbi:MAG TPA: GNVR domain-containing protein [Saprospiraceae bacterium]|nr:GNVR domain-containing protein [Saprospiraceae bacterium]
MEEQPVPTSDAITMMDLVRQIRSWIAEIIKHWYVVAFFVVLAIGYQGYRYFKYIPLYTATITFNVDEDEGGGNQGLTGILGQFGLGAVRPSRYNLDKILALSKSRRVIQESLFSKITVDGKEDYIANHLLREYKLNANGTDSKASSFYFTHDSLQIFTPEENAMLLTLYGTIIGPPDQPKKALMASSYNEDSNIMTLSVTTTNETISLALAQRMFDSLSKYYINKAIEKSLKTFNLVSMKRDSVLGVLKATEYQLASFKDAHRSMLMRTDQITELRLQREVAALTAMYAEVLKNVEVADFTVKNKTPFIQVIDTPLAPIQPALLSFLRLMLFGILAGGFIGSALVIARRIYLNAFK